MTLAVFTFRETNNFLCLHQSQNIHRKSRLNHGPSLLANPHRPGGPRRFSEKTSRQRDTRSSFGRQRSSITPRGRYLPPVGDRESEVFPADPPGHTPPAVPGASRPQLHIRRPPIIPFISARYLKTGRVRESGLDGSDERRGG